MELSVLLARILGAFAVIIAWSFLLNQKRYHALIKDIFKHEGFIFISASLGALAGLFIVITHPVWELSFRGLITLSGWTILIKAIILLLFPESAEKLSKRMNKSHWFWVSGAVVFVAGLYLIYYGFFG